MIATNKTEILHLISAFLISDATFVVFTEKTFSERRGLSARVYTTEMHHESRIIISVALHFICKYERMLDDDMINVSDFQHIQQRGKLKITSNYQRMTPNESELHARVNKNLLKRKPINYFFFTRELN